MKEKLSQILVLIDSEIDEIDLYGYDIIPTSLSMVHRLQGILNDLRNQLQTYVFPTKEDEISFFKSQKPEILGRLLYFHKIYRIETQCPNGSNEAVKSYLNKELDNLTYFFNRNLDFYQYYRSHSTYMMNIILFVESLIYAYVPIAHNSIKTRISRPAMIIRWLKS